MIDTIVIGGSAGGLDALLTVLPALPPTFAIPIVLVLHLPPHKPSYLVQVLAAHCLIDIREVEDKVPLCSRTLHVAPPNYHVLIERGRTLALSVDEAVHYSRPSIDVLFESGAEALGAKVLGVLLSGANEDGAEGLAAIHSAGGVTVVQSPETAFARTMPDAALRMNPAHEVLPLEQIGPFLTRLDVGPPKGRSAS